MRTKLGSHLEKSLSARFPLVVDKNRRYVSRLTTRKKATRQAVCCELGFLIRADWEKLAGSHPDSHIADICPRRRVLYVKPPLTWVSHRRPSRKAGSPYHGIGRGAVRRRSRERHRIAVRHAADPCGEEGARRRAQGAIAGELASRASGPAGPSRCPRCGSPSFVRKGRDRDGGQRWLCRGRARTFSARTRGLLASSKLPASAWMSFAECMCF